MGKLSLLILSLLVPLMAFSQQEETVYSWESPSGTVNEMGGTIAQHNSLAISRINYKSSGYHTIQLCGKKENIGDEDNSLNSVYFTITLADGATFKQGDSIVVTAMRNHDGGGKSNIHFVYGNGTVVDDANTWANLGQMHEINMNGGMGAKGFSFPTAGEELTGAGTEPIGEFSLDPSTNSFIVPAEADGSTTLTLTRNESECMLYITKFLVVRVSTEKKPLKGDVNGDGVVNISDVNAIITIMCGDD